MMARLKTKSSSKNEYSFESAYRLFHNKVYSIALHYLSDASLAEDTLQDVFLKLWLLKDHGAEIVDLNAYLFITTKHQCLNMLRKINTQSSVSLEHQFEEVIADNTTYESILYNDCQHSVNIAISQLPQQQNKVFKLCHIEGLDYREASKVLNIAPETIRSHYKRALKYLRSYLNRSLGLFTIAFYCLLYNSN
jgi:RNA polymerase sigma-70 factor (ECF subfamily)